MIRTTLQLSASAGLTGALFGVPVALALFAGTMSSDPAEPEPEPPVVTVTPVIDAAPELHVLVPDAQAEVVAVEPEAVPSEVAVRAAPASARGRTTTARVEFGGRRPGSRPTTTLPSTTTRTAAAPRQRCKDSPAVREVGDGRYEVDRGWMAQHSAPTELANAGVLDWHEGRDGRRDGFELERLRCGTLFQLGLRQGDVVHSIDGRPIKGPSKAAAAYRNLSRQDRFEVRITRDGRTQTLVYRVV